MDEIKTPEAGGEQSVQPKKLDLDVKVYPTQREGNILATANITLGGCFAVKGLRVMDGKDNASQSVGYHHLSAAFLPSPCSGTWMVRLCFHGSQTTSLPSAFKIIATSLPLYAIDKAGSFETF